MMLFGIVPQQHDGSGSELREVGEQGLHHLVIVRGLDEDSGHEMLERHGTVHIPLDITFRVEHENNSELVVIE